MMIVKRVKELEFPLDQIVVIGSGLLDAYGLREAGDIDLVVTDSFFKELKATGEYEEGNKYGETYLEKDGLEAWLTWGKGIDFAYLQQDGIKIDGVTFINPQLLMQKKRERNTAKDIKDITLLERYLDEQ